MWSHSAIEYSSRSYFPYHLVEEGYLIRWGARFPFSLFFIQCRAVQFGSDPNADPDHAGSGRKHWSGKVWKAKFIAAIRALNARMNIPDKLTGIQKEDISGMAKHAEKEANPLYPVPKLMTEKELEGFYYKIADWSETK